MKPSMGSPMIAAQSAESRHTPAPFSVVEAAFHFGLAAFFILWAAFLQMRDPVAYIRLINEDQIGEYATAFAYLCTALIFATLAWHARATARRSFWLLITAAAVFVGGEEISWGQRLLGIGTPEALRGLNRQGELTLHNVIDTSSYYAPIGVLIVVGVVVSAILLSPLARSWAVAYRLRVAFDAIGFPLVPLALAPWFLVTAYMFLGSTFIIGNELGELPFSLAITLLAVYCMFRFSVPDGGSTRARVTAAAAVLAVIAGVAQLLVMVGYAGGISQRLHNLASVEYPHRGLYAQSEMVFEYLDRHPRLRRDDTAVLHARLLLDRGKKQEATLLLEQALTELDKSGRPADPAYFRDKGEILLLMSRESEGREQLQRARDLDYQNLASAAEAAKAEILWSLARTSSLMGDRVEAIQLARQAQQAAPTADLAKRIGNWANGLELPEKK